MAPITIPVTRPTNNSFIKILIPLSLSNSPNAIPRTTIVNDCVPAFPPIPATIGIKVARVTT